MVNLKPKYLIIKDCGRGTVLLKQTTDRHEASRGLSATAELLVLSTCILVKFGLTLNGTIPAPLSILFSKLHNNSIFDIKRDIGRNRGFVIPHLHSTSPLKEGVPVRI